MIFTLRKGRYDQRWSKMDTLYDSIKHIHCDTLKCYLFVSSIDNHTRKIIRFSTQLKWFWREFWNKYSCMVVEYYKTFKQRIMQSIAWLIHLVLSENIAWVSKSSHHYFKLISNAIIILVSYFWASQTAKLQEINQRWTMRLR